MAKNTEEGVAVDVGLLEALAATEEEDDEASFVDTVVVVGEDGDDANGDCGEPSANDSDANNTQTLVMLPECPVKKEVVSSPCVKRKTTKMKNHHFFLFS